MASVHFDQQQGVAHIRFNRPERHNALGREELAGIENAVASLNAHTRAVVISAEGDKTFCAGADLGQISSGELDGDRFQSVTNQLAAIEVPTVCAMAGNVFGGGVELAMSCDFRIAAEDMMMRVPASVIGLCYPIQGIERLVARLGLNTTKRILVAAEPLSAVQMRELGIVTKLVARDEVLNNALAFAAELATRAPLSVRAMLSIMRDIETDSLDREAAAQLAKICSESEDLQEGLAASRERRSPQFKGR